MANDLLDGVQVTKGEEGRFVKSGPSLCSTRGKRRRWKEKG